METFSIASLIHESISTENIHRNNSEEAEEECDELDKFMDSSSVIDTFCSQTSSPSPRSSRHQHSELTQLNSPDTTTPHNNKTSDCDYIDETLMNSTNGYLINSTKINNLSLNETNIKSMEDILERNHECKLIIMLEVSFLLFS
ncbi:unnamed protein product [Trichobilharzia regenti]|nr:unnamed protein product [Trichobilharzia regenti]